MDKWIIEYFGDRVETERVRGVMHREFDSYKEAVAYCNDMYKMHGGYYIYSAILKRTPEEPTSNG